MPEATASDWATVFSYAGRLEVAAGLSAVQGGEEDQALYLITEGTLRVRLPRDDGAVVGRIMHANAAPAGPPACGPPESNCVLGTYHIQHYKFRRNAPSHRQHTGPDPAGHIEVSPSLHHEPMAPVQRGHARIGHN